MDLLTVLLDSKEIKRLIVQRSLDYNIPLRHLCWEAGINYADFMKGYINVLNGSDMDISEKSFRNLLGALGITIRYQVIIDSEKDMVEQGRLLADKYKDKNNG